MSNEATLTTKEAETNERGERTRTGATYRPRVDILEHADELLLRADMPGVKAGEIDVRFEDGELTIRGPVAPRQNESAAYLLNEYGVGDFYRTFRVSEQIDATKIHAEYAGGVLTVHLPKTEAVKPRKIEVRA
ncbi:MAG TPA: Hsp20/alpha crystallin family protein [Pirellulales bacterium]|jgi:HSP20 family molecular chaperone IbpA|nr:Hsp20/alpha crystallin family protein [Pirellulales bacterium]